MSKKHTPGPQLSELFTRLNLTTMTILFDSILLLIILFKWRLISAMSSTFYPVFMLALGFIFFILLALSVVNAIVFYSSKKNKALIPLIINIILLIMLLFFPVDPINVRLRFGRNRDELLQAIQWYQSEYTNGMANLYSDFNVSPGIPLPKDLSHLAIEGEMRMSITSNQTNYFFPVLQRDILNMEGFMYIENTNTIVVSPSFYHLEGKWYWVEK